MAFFVVQLWALISPAVCDLESGRASASSTRATKTMRDRKFERKKEKSSEVKQAVVPLCWHFILRVVRPFLCRPLSDTRGCSIGNHKMHQCRASSYHNVIVTTWPARHTYPLVLVTNKTALSLVVLIGPTDQFSSIRPVTTLVFQRQFASAVRHPLHPSQVQSPLAMRLPFHRQRALFDFSPF